MQEIKIIIPKNGKVRIEVAGVRGSACHNLTKSIETALGKTESVKRKPEFYHQQAVGTKQQVGHS